MRSLASTATYYVWFDDGTVVLQAEKTLFRVYRGVLAAQSPIFRDTFAIPQPPTQDTYDGCLLVILHDSPEDLRIFLKAIHDAGYFVNTPVDGIQTLSSLLRLATKYDVEHIRIRMISILTAIYPSSLTGWLEREPPAGYAERRLDDFLALRLAVDHNILPVLPGIYYDCCLYPNATILNNAHISLAEKIKCIEAQDTFDSHWCSHVYDFLFARPETCLSPSGCALRQLRWLKQNRQPEITQVVDEFYWNGWDMCTECTIVAKRSFHKKRSSFWETLPTLFELGTWEELLSNSPG
ncbi:hypothetical protein K438DRAFT_1969224 [Mycena galopus ATCC 62051]|nr:hypothetical protein K438DRAFT_1969224 [Mycena galopus ATCC 62051]